MYRYSLHEQSSLAATPKTAVERRGQHVRHLRWRRGRDQGPRALCPRGYAGHPRAMLGVGGAKAKIYDLHLLLDRPSESRFENLNRGYKAVGENLHGEQRRLGRLELQDSGERGAVSQGVAIVRGLQHLALRTDAERHSAGDRADVRMGGVDAAIDERDTNARAGAGAQ